MSEHISPYWVEVSPPRHTAENLTMKLERFSAKYRRAVEAGHAVCLTDNAMGQCAFQGHELIETLRLPTGDDQVMIHLNTFHSMADLRWILDTCVAVGVRRLLVVSGDGSTRLPKLKPSDVGCTTASVTSVELIAFILRTYPGVFTLGAAFNQYEPADHEYGKLRRKLDAGAQFIITQPLIQPNPLVDRICEELSVPVILEAWMSPKVQLLSDCIGYDLGCAEGYDPMESLRRLRARYQGSSFYLALLDFKTQFDQLAAGGVA